MSLSSLFLDSKYRDIFGLIQMEFMDARDRLTLRQVAKGVNVISDREMDKWMFRKENNYCVLKELNQSLIRLKKDHKYLVKRYPIYLEIEKVQGNLVDIFKERLNSLDERDDQFILRLRRKGKLDQQMKYLTDRERNRGYYI
jgi:hypothetical protein